MEFHLKLFTLSGLFSNQYLIASVKIYYMDARYSFILVQL